jgi:hypothetical protein
MEDTIRANYRRLNGLEEPTDGRVRDESGKFAKKPTEEPTAQPAVQPVAVETPAAAPYNAYPSSWKKGMDQDWAKLSPTMREEIHRREQNFLDGIKEYREPAAFGRAIGQEMLPHVETMRHVGVTPQQLTKEVMGLWSTLVRGSPDQKRGVLLQLSQQYGIDMSAQSPAATTGAQTAAAPAFDMTPVLQRVESVEKTLAEERQERARVIAEQANEEVKRFAQDSKRTHFAAVQETMSQLIGSGQAATLEDAYDKAIWLVPDVRAKLLAEQDATKRVDEAAKAAAARKAAAVNVPRRGIPPVAPKTGSMEDTIRSKLRELQAQN